MIKKVLKISGILFAITFATALLLSLTNEATKDIIEARKKEAETAAMMEVISADNYNLVDSAEDDYVVYAAFDGNTLVGYSVSLAEQGYGGKINMMIGLKCHNSHYTVSGVSITGMSETAGLGDNAKKPEFTNMFKGLEKEEIALKGDGGKIDALTGATVTSKAVVKGVARSIEIVSNYKTGGAGNE